MAAEPILRVQGLKKYFPVTKGLLWTSVIGSVKAVDVVSFSIQQGETLALVGESGCGKTTTAKLILRLEEPTAGQVFLDGQDVHALRGNALKEYRAMVQAVFQDPWSSLSPRMRVRDIVAEPLVINQRLSSREVGHRVAEILDRVGLRPEQADLYPHEFSGGQRQRIAVASALVSNPKLIVLDEPVSALDVSIRAQIMNLLVDLQQQYHVGYLLIAHHLATTRYMAHEVAVMYLGKIVEKARTEELFKNPLHPYTKALFSAALPAHPDIEREEIILPGEVPSPINPPSGCRFHPRCHFAMPRCSEIEPEERDIAPGHMVACHLYYESELFTKGPPVGATACVFTHTCAAHVRPPGAKSPTHDGVPAANVVCEEPVITPTVSGARARKRRPRSPGFHGGDGGGARLTRSPPRTMRPHPI